jgi:hypothetical protein
MTGSKIEHFKLWLSDRDKKYTSRQHREQRILRQEFYFLKDKIKDINY